MPLVHWTYRDGTSCDVRSDPFDQLEYSDAMGRFGDVEVYRGGRGLCR